MATSDSKPQPAYVTVSALDGGHLTLPERLFVTDADPDKRSTVPSLAFLIQHPPTNLNLVFDLGVKRDLNGYTAAQRIHIAQRQPVLVSPDVATSLGPLLDPARDIDLVILSHVHWDHVGTSSDFPAATFAVGSGTLDLLKNGGGPLYPAELFNDDELPALRTVEFPPVPSGGVDYDAEEHETRVPQHTPVSPDTLANLTSKLPAAASWSWHPIDGFPFPHALDFFGDGSLYVIDSPGHLYAHVNLLARLGERRYVYLGGDCCHDPRILAGDKDIAIYPDGKGGVRSVHIDTAMARRTLDRLAAFTHDAARVGEVEIEVVVAHDGVWRELNRHRFWPGRL
ncbi:beta-lactamase-like protein [Podospora appendiculata]|uniref:Beta-lactamase-like protein n=1 Tax=Podospora appendiculata TaxID=314037 RepID=A0AAE0X8Q7_9PEZI|nr:beta-lactamase-like protein [Podospora appendiculata]